MLHELVSGVRLVLPDNVIPSAAVKTGQAETAPRGWRACRPRRAMRMNRAKSRVRRPHAARVADGIRQGCVALTGGFATSVQRKECLGAASIFVAAGQPHHPELT